MAKSGGTAIGIDLGTTFSRVAVYHNGNVRVILNNEGNSKTPNYVAFTENEVLVGESAKNRAVSNAENTIFNVKRLLGRKFDVIDYQRDTEYWPFKVIEDEGAAKVCAIYKGVSKRFYPQEISAMVLAKIKKDAEAYLGHTITDAVITVPSYFNTAERQTTKDAGKIAGLNVMRLINESSAAALAYGLNGNVKENKNILVIGLGGGNTSVAVESIEEIKDGGFVIECLSVAGDTFLGGEDINKRVMAHFIEEFKSRYNRNPSFNVRALQRLREASETAKCVLSSNSEASVELDALYEGKDFYYRLTREKFEGICEDLFFHMLNCVEQVLADSKIVKEDIHEVLIVGGSSRIPKIQAMLKEFFRCKQQCLSVNPDEAAVIGSAVQAAILSGNLDYKLRNVLLLDAVSHSLGLETTGGAMTKLIKKNFTLPTRIVKPFTTYFDNQRGVDIQIFEGEKEVAKENLLLGRFQLSGIPPAPKLIPQIEICFDLDANGILQVSATEKSSGKPKSICIRNQNSGGFSEEDIERIRNEIQQYEKESAEWKERMSNRNDLESYIYFVKEKADTVSGDDLSPSDKTKVTETCENVIQWLNDNTSAEKDEIEFKMQQLKLEVSPLLKLS